MVISGRFWQFSAVFCDFLQLQIFCGNPTKTSLTLFIHISNYRYLEKNYIFILVWKRNKLAFKCNNCHFNFLHIEDLCCYVHNKANKTLYVLILCTTTPKQQPLTLYTLYSTGVLSGRSYCNCVALLRSALQQLHRWLSWPSLGRQALELYSTVQSITSTYTKSQFY